MMNYSLRVIVCLWVWVLAICSGYGQELPAIRHFAPQTYEAQNQNWAIAQGSNLHMYFGNNDGLLEFDGVHWRKHPMPSVVRAVATGSDGKVYIGCFGEFGYFERVGGKFGYTSLAQTINNSLLQREEIWHILVHEQAVYFQSFSTIYKYAGGKVETIVPPSSIMFLFAANQRLLLQSIDNELFELGSNQQFFPIPGTELLRGKVVQGITALTDQTILVGTQGHGLYLYKEGKLVTWNTPANAALREAQINKMLKLHDGRIAIGTILNGIYILNQDGRILEHFNRELGLQNNTVLALFQDAQNNLWAGLDKGIDYLTIGQSLRYYTDPQGITGTPYSMQTDGKTIYLGTNQGVFSRLEDEPRLPFRLVPGTQGQTWQLFQIGKHLYCGHNNGLYLIQSRERVVRISEVTGAWQTIAWHQRPGWYLQGTYTGLAAFQLDVDGILRFRGRMAGYQEPVSGLAFDHAGMVWVAHPNGGLRQLTLDTLGLKVQQAKLIDLPIALQKSPLRLMAESNQIIIYGAGYRYALQPQSAIWKLLDDADLVTPDVRLFCHERGAQVIYGHASAIQLPFRIPPQYPFMCTAPDSTLFLGHESGYTRIPPALHYRKKAVAPAILAFVHETDTLLTGQSDVQIPPSAKSVKALISLTDFDVEPVFWFRIPGYINHWTQTRAGECTLGKLPPGRYQLQVHTGQEAQAIKADFKVLTPWYQQWWMLLVYGGLFLLGFWYLERYQQRRLERQRMRLEAEKQAELDKQKAELERQRLEQEVERTNRELTSATFNLIRKNEMLQKIKDDLHEAQTHTATVERVVRQVDLHIEGDHDWEVFQAAFNQIHNDFFRRLQTDFPDLTPGDLRLCAYLRLNLSSKEIAPLFNISVRGVENKRYRLRKRLGLTDDTNLVAWLISY